LWVSQDYRPGKRSAVPTGLGYPLLANHLFSAACDAVLFVQRGLFSAGFVIRFG
jgi:hypothetical protein